MEGFEKEEGNSKSLSFFIILEMGGVHFCCSGVVNA